MSQKSPPPSLPSCDIAIIGSALAGRFLAQSLSQVSPDNKALSIALIDSQVNQDPAVSVGGRALSLNLSSMALLDYAGVRLEASKWVQAIELKLAQSSLSVALEPHSFEGDLAPLLQGFEKKHHLKTKSVLGAVVSAQKLHQTLFLQNQQNPSIRSISGSLIRLETEKTDPSTSSALPPTLPLQTLTIQEGQNQKTLKSKLVVFCSGLGLDLGPFGFNTSKLPSPNQALIASVLVKTPLQLKAYQRYFQSGVCALLPGLSEDLAVAILTTADNQLSQAHTSHKTSHKKTHKTDSENKAKETLSRALLEVYPDFFKEVVFESGKLGFWPIHRQYVQSLLADLGKTQGGYRLSLGAASFNFSPIMAQGFNLIVADVVSLAQAIKVKGLNALAIEQFNHIRTQEHQKKRLALQAFEQVAHDNQGLWSLKKLGIQAGLMAMQLPSLQQLALRFLAGLQLPANLEDLKSEALTANTTSRI